MTQLGELLIGASVAVIVYAVTELGAGREGLHVALAEEAVGGADLGTRGGAGADTDCSSRTCIDETCGVEHEPVGTSCTDSSGQACDGSGTCVECTLPAHCSPGHFCVSNLCVPACIDGQQSGGETDVDCGGPVCLPCAFRPACLNVFRDFRKSL